MTDTNTNTQALIDFVAAHAKAEIVQVEGQNGQPLTDVLVLPAGLAAHSVKKYLDEYRSAPERRQGNATFTDLASLIAHANRFKDADSALFACDDRSKPHITAVLDYHRAGAESAPRFGRHRGVYNFPLSDEWKAWMAANGKGMAQSDFAAFLEDRIVDVIPPPDFVHADFDGPDSPDKKLADLAELLGGNFAGPAKLMEMARGLSVNQAARVKNAANLSSGEISVQFETEHQDTQGQPIKVPNLFLIAIPVFVNGAAYRIAVRLRYRLDGGSIKWSYQLYRTDKVFDHAFDEAVARAATETGLPVLRGQPESERA